jgi:hypothetical protein
MSDQWQADVDHALEKYRELFHCLIDGYAHVVAEAGTGSRYSVIVTVLGDTSVLHEGGRYLVSVLAPWQNCWTWSGGDMDMVYVGEHLKDPTTKIMHGGDLAALTHAVNRTLSLASKRGR